MIFDMGAYTTTTSAGFGLDALAEVRKAMREMEAIGPAPAEIVGMPAEMAKVRGEFPKCEKMLLTGIPFVEATTVVEMASRVYELISSGNDAIAVVGPDEMHQRLVRAAALLGRWEGDRNGARAATLMLCVLEGGE